MKLEPPQVRFIVKVLALLVPLVSWAGIFLLPYGGVNIANCLPFPDQTYCQNLTAGAPLSTLTSAAGAPINWPTVLVVPLGVLTFLTFFGPWAVALYGRFDRYAFIPMPLGLVVSSAPWFGLAPEWGYGVIIGLFWISYVASLYYASLRQAESEAEAKAKWQRRWAEDTAASSAREAARAEAEVQERTNREARARAEAEPRAAYQGPKPPTSAGARPPHRPPPSRPPQPPRGSVPPTRDPPPGSRSAEADRERLLVFMNLPTNATKEQIRGRYRELAKMYHPDHSRPKSKTAEEMMKKLNEAKDFFGF
jgi:hypothetical protein